MVYSQLLPMLSRTKHLSLATHSFRCSPFLSPLLETRMIEDYWDFDEVFPESRLASMMTLTNDMNGMIVYVPPRVDDSNP